jgi:hypothetical protein
MKPDDQTDQTEDQTAQAPADAGQAEAEAAERAKAEADAAAKAAEKGKRKKLSEADLRAAITAIEAGNTDMHRGALVEKLREIKGARLEDADGTYRVKLHGLEVTNTAGWSMALTNWCSKARRAVLTGEAE